MDFDLLDKALLPSDKKLQAQEKFRRSIGVKEVDRPTYEHYITGDLRKFDRRKVSSMLLRPESPFGQDIRERSVDRRTSGCEELNKLSTHLNIK